MFCLFSTCHPLHANKQLYIRIGQDTKLELGNRIAIQPQIAGDVAFPCECIAWNETLSLLTCMITVVSFHFYQKYMDASGHAACRPYPLHTTSADASSLSRMLCNLSHVTPSRTVPDRAHKGTLTGLTAIMQASTSRNRRKGLGVPSSSRDGRSSATSSDTEEHHPTLFRRASQRVTTTAKFTYLRLSCPGRTRRRCPLF